MKKTLLYALLLSTTMVACTGDYEDWAAPQNHAQEDGISFNGAGVQEVGTIDFAQVTESTVKVASITAPTSSSSAYKATGEYSLLVDGVEYAIDANGYMSTDELVSLVESKYGKRPTTRDLDATLVSWLTNGSTTAKVTTAFQIHAIPEAPVIEEAYYITGGINGWNNSNTDYVLKNSGADVYDDPIFTCLIPADVVGGGFEYKVTPESGLGGDWSKCLTASDTEGKFWDQNRGGNLAVTGVEGAMFYKLVFDMLNMTYEVQALSFNQFVYFIGATDGWSKAYQKLESPDYSGVYTGFVYVADPNGWGLQFKFQRIQNSWDNEINSGTFSSITGDLEDCGGNIGVTAGEGVYFFTMDLANATLNAVKVNTMGIIGDFNGWSSDAVMTWDAENYCYVAENPGITSNGWKFRINEAWDINLGGTIDELVANGDNLTVTGNVVKLYPTRKDKDKIYCTLE